MEQIIKQAKRLGNGAGVILPKKWENSLVKIELIKDPLKEIELLNLLHKEIGLEDIIGIYLIGSYARKDNNEKSDIDILVVSNDLDKEIHKDNYEITIIPKYILDAQKGYPLYYSMLKEAKVILNKHMLDDYKKDLKINLEGVNEYLQSTKNNIKKSEKLIKESELEESDETNDAVAYSLVLRLRGLYNLNCILKNKIPIKKEFLSLIKNITGSLNIYYRYLAVKNNEDYLQNSIKINDAKKIIKYLNAGINEWEKIVKDKGKN